MSTIENILLVHDVYSLDLELELLRCFENTRQGVNPHGLEHAIERSRVSYFGEYNMSNLPTIESILANHGVTVKALVQDLQNFFSSNISHYKYLGFGQVIIPSRIALLVNQQARKCITIENRKDQPTTNFTRLLKISA
ncbi:hypothetical protein [Neptuniibacter sp.]|uniref:hypothetical protein n=1 Tax=Neptuniibacter sp. TaxID=1962643 RepID=UPI0026249047|nr:hypothetical protein [Neptuniibacter sp.]MCP4598906.1 hypothetical protein [Neptuniibacter sp.]